MKDHIPLVRGLPLIKGFLCGSFLSAAFMTAYGILFQAIFFLLFFIIFVDAICAFGRAKHNNDPSNTDQ